MTCESSREEATAVACACRISNDDVSCRPFPDARLCKTRPKHCAAQKRTRMASQLVTQQQRQGRQQAAVEARAPSVRLQLYKAPIKGLLFVPIELHSLHSVARCPDLVHPNYHKCCCSYGGGGGDIRHEERMRGGVVRQAERMRGGVVRHEECIMITQQANQIASVSRHNQDKQMVKSATDTWMRCRWSRGRHQTGH